jgi:hypothetical protein
MTVEATEVVAYWIPACAGMTAGNYSGFCYYSRFEPQRSLARRMWK